MGILLKEMILETSKDKEIQDVIHVLQHNLQGTILKVIRHLKMTCYCMTTK